VGDGTLQGEMENLVEIKQCDTESVSNLNILK
jgi:hypothetical protein